VSGCIAIVLAFNEQYMNAAWFIALAAVFDFFDGFAARLLKAYSPLGKELDSLADIVSFGVAPGMMIFSFISDLAEPANSSEYLAYVAFLIPALFWAFGIGSSFNYLLDTISSPILMVITILISSWLLVSNIPMFSLKFKHFRWLGNRLRYSFLASCLFLLILLGTTGISACILWYILLSLFSYRSLKKPA
jgi:CDP-diacylglycerol--serine O-phosphatidyltransferase